MKRSLLLHVCCAGCLGKAISSLQNNNNRTENERGPHCPHSSLHNETFTLYYDNSNIHPRTEWLARLEAVKKVAGELGLKLIAADWSPKKWYEAIGHNADNTDQQRCKSCWQLRLKNTAEKARELGYPHFSSTLLSSNYQDRKEITRIGKSAAGNDLEFVSFDIAQDCASPSGIYLQNYCGCVYSLKERYEEKWRHPDIMWKKAKKS